MKRDVRRCKQENSNLVGDREGFSNQGVKGFYKFDKKAN